MRWLEVSPIAGRTPIPADGEQGAERVVVLRESLWRRRYSADPNLIGRQIVIGGQSRTVVGVMPDSFEFPGRGELWLPLDELRLGGMNEAPPGVRMFGVLRPAVSFEAATTEINALSSIALSVGLLNAAITMARAFEAYVEGVPSLPRNQVLTVQLGRVESAVIRDQIVAAAAAMPGVIAAGAGQNLPRLYPLPRPTAVEPIDGEPTQSAMPAPSHAVGNGFLEAIGARTLSGRLFTAADFSEGAAPVAVVNEPFVQKYFGGRNPIGRRIRIDSARKDGSQEP